MTLFAQSARKEKMGIRLIGRADYPYSTTIYSTVIRFFRRMMYHIPEGQKVGALSGKPLKFGKSSSEHREVRHSPPEQ